MTHEFCSIFIRNTVKHGRYLTSMVSSDEIQHDHPLPWQPSSVFLAADQSLGSVCPGLAEPRSRSELTSADQCLKFCDDTPSAATLPTLNNAQDLDSECSAASFLVQWTKAQWNTGRRKRQRGVNGVQALCPAGPRSRCSRYGELPTMNLVRVRSRSITLFILESNRTDTRSVSASFETATETITLCKKCFIPIWSRSADTSLTLHLICWISSGLTTCVKRSSLFYSISNANGAKLMRHWQIQCNFGVLTIYAN